ncbi:uncharacterized protein LOC110102892 [Dendrobium catenatum]|uniref:Uncharacterized protein n=1 Tax=Dendrobium catenatum TaxID=906689 RepID=A0A2I0VNB3_9ASPA|nr:uncharacterized protein LOC110102892 [Dendrobium catenatum]PKU64891.1 hypothetical protein MA16_Dca022340 [Dendrobium catenatum]
MGEWSSSRRRTMMHQNDSGRPTTTAKYGGLPPSSGHSYHSVPPWEIKFCSQISWTKFCEDKKLTYLFENVLNWDDSAGKESFDNAKARYWAGINGLHCDIPLPNPDMYIDVVNQDTFLDPRLVEDLYKQPPPPPLHKEIPDYNSIEIIPTGWDVEDPATSGATIPKFISAGDHHQSPMEQPSQSGHSENQILESDAIVEPVTIVPTGWGDEDSGSSNAWELSGRHSNDALCYESRKVDHKDVNFVKMNYSSWSVGRESSWEHNYYWNGTKYGNWGKGRPAGRRFSSKPANSRDKGEYYQMNGDSRGCSGRRKNHTDEYYYWHGCAPANNH